MTPDVFIVTAITVTDTTLAAIVSGLVANRNKPMKELSIFFIDSFTSTRVSQQESGIIWCVNSKKCSDGLAELLEGV
jgi:hypothetical protein